jgi:putative endonuclease
MVRRGTVILAQVVGLCFLPATLGDNAVLFFALLMLWFLYLIECSDGSLYTGIATDVEARFAKHLSGEGARYTRSHPPLAVRASFQLGGRAEASRAEYWVKRLPTARKWELVAGTLALDQVVPQAA